MTLHEIPMAPIPDADRARHIQMIVERVLERCGNRMAAEIVQQLKQR